MLDIPRWTEEDSVERESLELSLWTQKEAGSIALSPLEVCSENPSGMSMLLGGVDLVKLLLIT